MDSINLIGSGKKRALWVLFILPALLPAQTDRATLTGTILDPSGAGVQGARIRLKAIDTGVERTANTNGVGSYSITSLPVGDYTASVAASGFETVQFQRFTLEVGQTRTLNATMTV